ncbi:MAG TPA: hypothetical protein PLQ72_02975 [Candidatus Pacearchaeota archaeon]|nr:hypothetical protein [Candidatus Pacearchaeota archaeon]
MAKQEKRQGKKSMKSEEKKADSNVVTAVSGFVFQNLWVLLIEITALIVCGLNMLMIER